MNPYQTLPPKAFWKLAVAERSIPEIDELWEPKFQIGQNDPIVTFGSCFAQHIGKALKGRGFNWLTTESAPRSMGREASLEFNYGVFSCRTANIYTTSLLRNR